VDYTAVSGTLNWPRATRRQDLYHPILNDGTIDPNETVNLILSDPTGGAMLGTQSTAVLTIVEAPRASIPAVSLSPRYTPVDALTIVFSEPIAPSTFTTASLSLQRAGVTVPLAGATLITSDNQTFTLSGLTALTTPVVTTP